MWWVTPLRTFTGSSRGGQLFFRLLWYVFWDLCPLAWLLGYCARLRVLQAWWHEHDTVARDRWIAAAFTGLAFTPVLAHLSSEFGDLPRRPSDAFAIVLILAQTLPLAVRSLRPAVCLAIVGLSYMIYQALGYPPQFGSVTVIWPCTRSPPTRGGSGASWPWRRRPRTSSSQPS